MLNLMRAEWYKLTRGNALWLVLGGLAVLFTVIQAFPSGNMSRDGTPLTFSDGFVYGVGESTFAIVSSIIFLALSVGRDFGNGTLTHYVSAGHSRSCVVFGRFFSLLAGFLLICFSHLFCVGCFWVCYMEWASPLRNWVKVLRCFPMHGGCGGRKRRFGLAAGFGRPVPGLLGLVIIIVAVSASSITVMRLKPREILSKMS